MSKNPTTPKIISHSTSFDEIAELLQGRKEVILKQKHEIETKLKQVRESDLWRELEDEDRERPFVLIESHLEDIDSNLLYIDAQLTMLQKAKNAMGTNDVEAMKVAVREYVISDMNMSLKNISMQVYDNTEIVSHLDDMLAME